MFGCGFLLDRPRQSGQKSGRRGPESHANNIDIHFLAFGGHS
jgi:hypothetical protein